MLTVCVDETSGACPLQKLEAFANILCIIVTRAVFHLDTSPLKADASSNMLSISVTRAVFHLDTSPLNADASLNMLCISVTRAVFHLDTSPLKVDANANMRDISVTRAVFHLDTSPLKADTLEKNIHCISVTRAVFHFDTSPLNADAWEKRPPKKLPKDVIRAVFHLEICVPSFSQVFPVGSVARHAFTADFSSEYDRGVKTASTRDACDRTHANTNARTTRQIRQSLEEASIAVFKGEGGSGE